MPTTRFGHGPFEAVSRRGFLAAALAVPLIGTARQPDARLIAHRGGIVDEAHPENSVSSMEAAIARGYWMLEVDIRRTGDGVPILQHDATFERYYGEARKVGEMSWAQIRELRSRPGNRRPQTFDEMCARAAGRIRLMLDIKDSGHPPAFHESLARSLSRHGLLSGTWVLSDGGAPEFWGERAKTAVNRRGLLAAVERGERVADTRVLFEIAGTLDQAGIALAREHGVTPVAAINTFRYRMAKVDDHLGARTDAARLRAAGVAHFQIDSIYERYLREPAGA